MIKLTGKAGASGRSLKTVRAIDYGWSEIRLTTWSFSIEGPAGSSMAAAPDLETDDIKASGTVTMTWGIEDRG